MFGAMADWVQLLTVAIEGLAVLYIFHQQPYCTTIPRGLQGGDLPQGNILIHRKNIAQEMTATQMKPSIRSAH